MKLCIFGNLLILSILLACSSTSHSYKQGSRFIASIDEMTKDFSPKKVNETIEGILHSYLLGQVRLIEFDNLLMKKNSDPMDTDTYHELQAIRILVDGYEEDISDYYLKLVLVSALPRYNEEDKNKARITLKSMHDFYNGVTPDQKELPENLRPMILGNLREKQAILSDELKLFRDESPMLKNDNAAVSVIDHHINLLNADRKKNAQDVAGTSAYMVDQKVLNQLVATESMKPRFQKFKSKIKNLSKKIKTLFSRVRKGRSISSDTYFPSTEGAGNINGSRYPRNTWSLTYDDGPGPRTTLEILRDLQSKQMKATFFVLGKQVETHPKVVQEIADAGMEIASHSYDHQQLTKVEAATLEKQIGESKKIIEKKISSKLTLFRLPYGAGVNNSTIRSKIAEHDMIHVAWNVDTLDWQDKNPESIFNRSVKQMSASSRGIILFHDIHKQSVTASAMLTEYLKQKKLTVCTVQSVIDQINKGLDTCHN